MSDIKYEKIFQDALGMLIKHHPFFGHIMANVVRVEDYGVKFFSLTVTEESKIALHYNLGDIKYVVENKKITLKNLTAMIQHTVYHLINEHFLRKKEKGYDMMVMTSRGPARLIDICFDLSINQYIENLPEKAVTLSTFQDKLPPEENAEYYYQVLEQEAKDNMEKIKSDTELDTGEIKGVLFLEFESDEKLEEALEKIKMFLLGKDEQKDNEDFRYDDLLIDDHVWENLRNMPDEMVHNTVKDIVTKAYHDTKFGDKDGYGTLPAGIERMIQESMKPAYDFRPILKRFVDGELFSHFKSTRKKPNRRFGFVFPGRQAVMKAKVAVLADTSGSMNENELGMITKNLQNINEYAQVVLFEVDTCIHYLWEFNPKLFKQILHGGGGTVFNDVFNVIEDYKRYRHLLDAIPEEQQQKAHMLIRDIKAMIIITDGEVSGHNLKKPKMPVMWALTSKCCSAPVNWGKMVYLDNDPDKHQQRFS